ncbi:MAG: hypothetical protein HYX55_07230 [Chloroflexi bacterium]|nr:hypothetical protein [Chloroflexota bacterium]
MSVAVGIVVVLLLATTALLNGTKRVQLNGISFDVPFAWTVHTDIPPTTGPGNAVALIGTLPWGPCDPYDINCHYRERLSSGQIEVEVSVNSLLGRDMCSFALDRPDLAPRTDGIRVTETHYFRADRRPAIVTLFSFDGATDYYGSDGWRTWMFAPANSVDQVYEISAKWRGPGDDDFIAALDRLVSSIRLPTTNPNSPVPDCGDPFPSVGAA